MGTSITEIQQEIHKVKLDIVSKVLFQNVASGMTGNMQVWFENGLIKGIRNTQDFGGMTIMDIDKITVYGISK